MYGFSLYFYLVSGNQYPESFQPPYPSCVNNDKIKLYNLNVWEFPFQKTGFTGGKQKEKQVDK